MSSLSNTGRPEDEYRARVAEAIANAECEKRPRCANCMTDAVLAVRDEEIEKLRAEIHALIDEQAEDVRVMRAIRRQRDEAEAATERVLKTAFAAVANYPNDTRTLIAAADFIASALDIERPLVVADVLRRAQTWLDARSGGEAR